MAWRTTVTNVGLDGDDELNLIKDARARSNTCYKCGEVGHLLLLLYYYFSKEIVSMMEISPWIVNRHQEDKHPLTPMILWWGSR